MIIQNLLNLTTNINYYSQLKISLMNEKNLNIGMLSCFHVCNIDLFSEIGLYFYCLRLYFYYFYKSFLAIVNEFYCVFQ